MTGFVATPPAPQSPPAATVKADGWFPDIDVNMVRDAMRLRGEVPHPRLVEALRGAILTVTMQLAAWKATWVAGGATALADVRPDERIDDQHRLSLLFVRAVRFYAAAELADMARDSSATNDEADRIEEEPQVAAEMKRIGLHAVRDMLGTTRVAVELI